MALSGNLREFDLADIFQLLGQQKKTGRLVLQEKKSQGMVYFHWGEVVAAQTASVSTVTMLQDYLTRIKQHPESRIREFLEFCKGNISLFLETTAKIQYLTEEEALALVKMGVEDLACELFSSKDGQYRFDPLDSVDEFMVPGVSFSTDAICMEAMRRTDEWARLKTDINDDMVFVPGIRDQGPDPVASATDPASLIRALLDGKQTVGHLCSLGFFTRYRIYEIVHQSAQSGQISLLECTAPDTHRGRASPAVFRRSSPWGARLIAVIGTGAAVGTVLLICVVLQVLILSRSWEQRRLRSQEIAAANSVRKYSVAVLQFRILEGSHPVSFASLREAGLLHARDLAALPLGRAPGAAEYSPEHE